MLFAAIPSICALSSKKISIFYEEMIVALCFIGFIILSRKSLGETFKMTLDGRIQAIPEDLKKTFFRVSFLISMIVVIYIISLWVNNWDLFIKISSRVGRTFLMRSLGSSLVPEVARVCLTGALLALSFVLFGGGLEPKVMHAAGEGSGSTSSQPRPFDLNRAPDAEPGAGPVPDLNAVPPQARRQAAI
jgi:hypothetical protein